MVGHMKIKKSSSAIVSIILAAGATGLVACSSDDAANDVTETAASVTATASEAAGDATSSASESANPDEAKPEECKHDNNAKAIHDAVGEINRDYRNDRGGWAYKGDSNYDPCGTVTYAVVEQDNRDGSDQRFTKVLFFHLGEYQGVDSLEPLEATEVTADPDGYGVTIKYSGGEEVYYYWDEQSAQLAHEGNLPGE